MKRLLFALLGLALFAPCLNAQLLSWTPDFPQDNNSITITVDATKGNQGLNNYSDPNDVYVHIGVITSASTSSTDWQHAPFTWATTPAAGKATSLGNNKYSYTINNIRTFFSANAGEVIYKIAILFRNGAGTVVQRNTDGSDMYVPVYDNNLAVRFTVPPLQPLYTPIPEPINKATGDNINITGIASASSAMKLYLNGAVIQTAASATTISANPTLTTSGNNEVVVEANNGTVTKKDTLRFFVSPGITIAPLPTGVRDGINYPANNTSVTLVLYAPNKTRVSVIGEFPGSNWAEQSQYLMNKTPDGNYWWLTINGLTAGTEYAFQYLVDGTLKVGEPYAEKVLDPAADGSIPAANYPGLRAYPAGQSGIVSIVQTAAPAYTWAVNNFARPDKRNLVVYELLVRDFLSASHWGTMTDTLSYLKKMGVNAIELMPIMEFGGNDSWGYDPSYFLAPDKYYGPKNGLKKFIDSCHVKGIAVILDIAMNHARGECPLAALYWNAAAGQPAPNNPWFNVVAPHPFSVFNDFNHESPATKYFFKRVVEHWLTEYKVDGFRFDLSKGYTQTNSGTNVALWSQYDASRVAIWKSYYDTLQSKSPGCYAILEHFADNSEELELSNYGMMLWGNLNYNFNQASMGYSTDWNFESGLYTARGWTNPFLVTYMESHDEERMMYKDENFGNSAGAYTIKDTTTALKRVEMCAAFLMGMPGPKMLWQFGELGYDYPINYCINDGTTSDNCRTGRKPVRWDYLQQDRRKRLYDIYSSLTKLRYNGWYKDVFTGNNVTIERNLISGFKWLKVRSATDSSQVLVVGNFDVTGQSGAVTFNTPGTWYDYLTGSTITATGSAQTLTLQPGEYHVYVNRNLTNPVTTPVIDINAPGKELQAVVYPNPVNAGSVLELNIPETGNVQVDIYDLSGKQLSTVSSGNMSKGIHFVSLLDKINNLPGGLYIMKVQSKNNYRTVKMLIQ